MLKHLHRPHHLMDGSARCKVRSRMERSLQARSSQGFCRPDCKNSPGANHEINLGRCQCVWSENSVLIEKSDTTIHGPGQVLMICYGPTTAAVFCRAGIDL
ncbi:hypothetical protein BJX65DRAFT_288059 [Aspergillus insuetus]